MLLLKKLVAAGVAVLAFSLHAAAQQTADDTLRLSLPETEALFLQKNLQLLAKHYNVASDSALIQQAKLWDNPSLTVDQNVYVNGHFFEHGEDANGNPTGQFYVQVQQLIQLGGKRSKAVKLAGITAGITHQQFTELMRSLRLALRKDYYTVLQLQRYASLYKAELEQIDKLSAGMEAQFKAGNIARKDLLRVQAVQVGLQQEQTENAKSLEDAESDLRTMLAFTGNEFVQPSSDNRLSLAPAMPSESLPDLIALAKENNTTFLIEAQQVAHQQQDLRYQKSLSVPDLNVGPNYDRASNFAPNYFGLTLGIPLPLWNRNQGNIRAAQYSLSSQQLSLQQADVTLQNDVRTAYRKLIYTLSITGAKTTEFYNSYRELFSNIIQSYQSRQISLLEFIDYINGYEDIREKQLQQQLNVQLAKEELNYAVGVDVVK